jgi:hypothetical protein
MLLKEKTPTLIHDVFISYSRQNKAFAEKLEQALENYKPPNDLKLEQRRLNVFRDEDDFTGVDYHLAVEQHLNQSAKLVVLCSPDARLSKYVGDEIRRFAKARGPAHIIPILVAGVYNNAVKPGQEAKMAFPDALCEVMEMPLAADFTAFDPRRDKINKGVFYRSWYTLLANIYGVRRDEIEQRDKKRESRVRTIRGITLTSVITVLSAALVFALFSRRQAVDARDQAEGARQAEARAREKAESSDKEAQEQRDAAIKAREGEKEQRKKAEDSAAEAREQRDIAVEQKQLADNTAYIANMNLAGSESERGNHRRVFELLDAYLPTKNMRREQEDRRSFYWYYLWRQNYRDNALTSHEDYGLSVAFSPDGRTLAIGSEFDFKLWDVESRKELVPLLGQVRLVNSVAFSLDGRTLAISGRGTGVELWNVQSRKKLATLRGHGDEVESVAFSPDGRMLASTSWDHSVKLWGVQSRKELATLPGHGDAVWSVAFSPDGRTLATASRDKSIKLWDVQSRKELATLLGHGDAVWSVAFSPDGRTLASASEDKSVKLWNGATDKDIADYSPRN